MHITDLLSALQKELSLPALEKNAGGYYPLEVDGMKLLLYPAPDGKTLAAIGHVGSVHVRNVEMIQYFMVANAQRTGGAHLAVDRNGNTFALQWFMVEAIDFQRFYDDIERFVDFQQHWCRQVDHAPPLRPGKPIIANV